MQNAIPMQNVNWVKLYMYKVSKQNLIKLYSYEADMISLKVTG